MRRLALALPVLLLAACPEQRPLPQPRHRVPQAALASGPGSVDVLTVDRPDGPEWFGLYLMGKKAGWSRAGLRREIRDGRDVLVSERFRNLVEESKFLTPQDRRIIEELRRDPAQFTDGRRSIFTTASPRSWPPAGWYASRRWR